MRKIKTSPVAKPSKVGLKGGTTVGQAVQKRRASDVKLGKRMGKIAQSRGAM